MLISGYLACYTIVYKLGALNRASIVHPLKLCSISVPFPFYSIPAPFPFRSRSIPAPFPFQFCSIPVPFLFNIRSICDQFPFKFRSIESNCNGTERKLKRADELTLYLHAHPMGPVHLPPIDTVKLCVRKTLNRSVVYRRFSSI